MSRRCLICANINPCRLHSESAQQAELRRNDAAIAEIRRSTVPTRATKGLCVPQDAPPPVTETTGVVEALKPFANIPIPPDAKPHWPINYAPVTARYSDVIRAREALTKAVRHNPRDEYDITRTHEEWTALLAGRDNFLASRGLFGEFADSLPNNPANPQPVNETAKTEQVVGDVSKAVEP